MSRTRRRKFRGSKRFDKTCRSHGSCNHCSDGRQHKHKRAMLAPDEGAEYKQENATYNCASQDEGVNCRETECVNDNGTTYYPVDYEVTIKEYKHVSFLNRVINYIKSCLTT